MKKGIRPQKYITIVTIILITTGLALFTGCEAADTSHREKKTTNEGGETMPSLTISSPDFGEKEHIPKKYSCKGKDINPELDIQDVPEGTESLVLIMDDPDAPGGTFDHWILFDIPADTSAIEENSVPENAKQGRNSGRNNSYGGPCPPSGTHRYQFKLYAVDTRLELPEGSTKDEVLAAIEDHILEKDTLTGMFSK